MTAQVDYERIRELVAAELQAQLGPVLAELRALRQRRTVRRPSGQMRLPLGSAVEDPLPGEVLRLLEEHPDGLTCTELTASFRRRKAVIIDTLRALLQSGALTHTGPRRGGLYRRA